MWLNAKDTTPLLFVKFGMHVNALHREVPFNMACANRTMEPLDDLSCNLKRGANPRQTYAEASKYPFGLSPPGNGLDCFRTYELLLNGIIPIVQRQPEYDELFEDLPVLQLRHWDYTQKELINKMKKFVFSPKFLNNTFDAGWDRLFLKHWRHKVLEDAGRLDEIITDPQGNQYYKAWQYTLNQPAVIQHATPEHLKIIKAKQEAEERRLRRAEEKEQGPQQELNSQTMEPGMTASASGQVSRRMREKILAQRNVEEALKVAAWEIEDNIRSEQVWNDVDMVKREIDLARRLQRKLNKRRNLHH